MLNKIETVQEINEFWNNLPDNQGTRIFKAQAYQKMFDTQELIEKEKPIREYLGRNLKGEIWIINDDFQIAEIEFKIDRPETKIVKGYHMFYQYKSLSEYAETFEMALIGLICYKMTGTTAALLWIKNMLNVR